MIKVNDKKRDIIDTIWSILTAFGYQEVEYNEALMSEVKADSGKYCYFENNVISAITNESRSQVQEHFKNKDVILNYEEDTIYSFFIYSC